MPGGHPLTIKRPTLFKTEWAFFAIRVKLLHCAQIALNKQLVGTAGNHFSFRKIKTAANDPADKRDRSSKIYYAFGPKLRQKSKPYHLIDFSQHSGWNFANHRHCKLLSKLNAGLFKNLLDGNTHKADIDQCLHLITMYIPNLS